jgi:hypothetical protein
MHHTPLDGVRLLLLLSIWLWGVGPLVFASKSMLKMYTIMYEKKSSARVTHVLKIQRTNLPCVITSWQSMSSHVGGIGSMV